MRFLIKVNEAQATEDAAGHLAQAEIEKTGAQVIDVPTEANSKPRDRASELTWWIARRSDRVVRRRRKNPVERASGICDACERMLP